MLAARLYGAEDMRIDDIPLPPPPPEGQVTIQVTSVGICGSDLHNYQDGRIGDTLIEAPIILGHEFAGIVTAVGDRALDGEGNSLKIGQRVAVDPATPCHRCEMCEQGHPNLCRRLHFCGLYPDDGSLQEYMNVAARSCFVVPDALSDDDAALLEPLGVALHAVDLGKLKLANSVAVLGCGPIGSMIIQLARLHGAEPIYAYDMLPWRVEKACAWGAHHGVVITDELNPVQHIQQATHGRGVDVVFEAAWADHSIMWAGEMARLGGRLVLVGIPSEDKFSMRHSAARRKGLTIMMSRRMKHTYPRTIQLATSQYQQLNLTDIVSHRFGLRGTPAAFKLNSDYQDNVQKIMINVRDTK
jgi:L-iditol 2-dehydrogenase